MTGKAKTVRSMRLDYLAHSCFLLEHEGFRLLFDPYDPRIGYPSPKLYSVDLIVVSHDHFDHNGVSAVSGACQVVRGVARRKFGPLTVDGEVGWHGTNDDSEPVSLTLIEWAGRRIAHFGDLGCPLTPEQKKRFQELDLLLLPCGGGYTIDGATAAQVVKELRPKIVVPMHYQTPFLDRALFPNFQTAQPFLEACSDFGEVRKTRDGSLDLDAMSNSVGEGSTLVYPLQHQMA